MLRILIVEGNVREAREKTVASGSLTQGELYKKTLLSLKPDMACEIICPADEDAIMPDDLALAQYDGVIWTGSALNIYQMNDPILRQIEFMKRCLGLKTKIFGSCWGLQVAVVAAGGEVAKNDKGREIGIARDIKPTVLGRSHPLYKGKTTAFDAVAIHLDHVVRLPEGATVLSGNDMSRVQAMEIKQGPSVFWGVQYHPEFDLDYIAALMQKYKGMMVEEGFCPDEGAVDQLSADYRAAQHDTSRQDIRQRHNMGADVLESCCRLQEISNWLDFVEKSSA